MKNEIILITGASGCVGQYIANWLIENSTSELFLWVRDPKKITSINLENPRIKILVGDLRESNKFKNYNNCKNARLVSEQEFQKSEALSNT